MSYHIYHPWKWEDEITEEFIVVVAQGVEQNKTGDKYGPRAFALLSVGDSCLLQVSTLLNLAIQTEEPITDEIVAEFIPEDFEHRDKAIEVTTRIVKKMNKFDVILNK